MEATQQKDLEYLEGPAGGSLWAGIPEPVARWFGQRIGTPTPIQQLAWPALTRGKHVLVSAPTGSGKTLTAFLPLIAEMVGRSLDDADSVWRVGSSLQALYVAPLKALTNDIAHNLTTFLDQLAFHLPPDCPLPRVGVRHGDTSPAERQALVEDPPDILLTTPESLAILLTQPALDSLFGTLRWVVIDEIHALAASKRGADLALSLERLELRAPRPLQRIGLSATAAPLAEAARFLVGAGRPCSIAAVSPQAAMELSIVLLDRTRTFITDLARRLEPVLEAERSTLIFAATRSLAERLSWVLRQRRPDWSGQIAVHHSALAASRRVEVERDLRGGRLRAVVCSTSLELGIDIGPIDRVVLIHPPGDVVRLLQRLGRSGHGPNRIRRGLVLAGSAAELLEATVTAASGQAGQCEPLHIPEQPLDVLCQQILGMACAEVWSSEEIHATVCRARPFRNLSRKDLDDCIRYLRGQDQHGGAWLPARLRGGLEQLTIKDRRTARLLRRNIGTILAEEAVAVCTPRPPTEGESGVCEDDFAEPEYLVIGEIDPHFAERLQPGDRFLLDGRCLEMRRLEASRVVVEEVIGRPLTPRWTGDGQPLSSELARRLYLLRTQAAEALRDGLGTLHALLQGDYGLEQTESTALVDYFERQEQVSEIPEPGVCLIEVLISESREVYFLHTPLSRAGNDALSRVVVHRLVRDFGLSAQSIVADLGWTLLPMGGSLVAKAEGDNLPSLWRTLLSPVRFAEDLEEALESSLTLRERFQRVATTGLMLLRNPETRSSGGRGSARGRVGGQRWGERRLFDLVRGHDPEFVLLRQARREIRAGWCDAYAAGAFVEQLTSWAVRCRWVSAPSPFVEAWTQEAFGGFETVDTPGDALRRLHARLMAGTASTPAEAAP